MIGDSWLDRWPKGGRQRHCLKLLNGCLHGPLLEVGCSEAALLNRMKDNAPYLECVGIDVDVEALRVAKRDHPPLNLVAAHAEELPFSDGVFGTVVMLDVLEHVSDDHLAIREIGRALRAGGHLVLTTPHRGLFSWLDVSNLKLQLPGLYQLFSRLTGARSHSLQQRLRGASPIMPAAASMSRILRDRRRELEHRHYSVEQLRTLLKGFRVECVRRTGLLVFPIMHVIGVFTSKVFRTHVQLFMEVAALEDSVEFGSVAYNVALRAVKDQGAREPSQ